MIRALRLTLIFALWTGLLVEVNAQGTARGGLLRDYYPSFCRAARYPEPGCEFVIFRDGTQSTLITLPFRLEFLAYARSGKAVYTLSTSTNPICVHRVDLSPVQVVPEVCPPGLATVFAFTVSADAAEVLVSGQIKGVGGVRCGVFDIRLADGETTQILRAGNCGAYNFQRSWTSLSLAPDSSRGVAVRMDQLELFENGKAGTLSIAVGIVRAAWSPDGRWIAALDRHGKTRLIDATDFKVKRTLGETEAEWSPDSRYLLSVKECPFPLAVNGVGTIRAIDIDNGNATEIRSSRCQVDNGSAGWVKVLPHG